MSKDIEIMLFQDLVQIIEQGKNQLAKQVNSTIALVYWHIGKRINEHVLDNKRAEYGKKDFVASGDKIGIHVWT